MRIVQLANFHGPMSGGIRTTLRQWRHGYVTAGHDSHLIVPGVRTGELFDEDGTTHTIRAPVIPGSGGYRVITALAPVRTLLDRLRPDVIEVSDRTTLVGLADWARSRGVWSTLVLHERLDNQARAILPWLLPHRRLVDWWNRRTATPFDAVVATSRYGSREMVRIGISPRQVPLGVDSTVFHPLQVRSAGDSHRLAYLGRLARDKRPDLALATLKQLVTWGHDVELVFIGEGPMRSELAQGARRLPVSFTGFVDDRPHVSSLLAGADVSIVPCPGECFGLAALESLAAGTPAVVAANSGAAELVADGGGLAVPPGPRGFAAAVEHILSDLDVFRPKAREVAVGYTWERSVEAMLGVHRGSVFAT